MNLQKLDRYIIRLFIFALGFTVLIAAAMSIYNKVRAVDAASSIAITTANAQPRAVEDATALAITRAYSAAWFNLDRALSKNDPSALNDNFVGYARDRYTAQIKDQKKNGMSVRLVAHAHAADALFYSIDGSALELHDNVQLEKQVFDGSKMIASETKTIPYVAILTVVGDRWKVRVLQQSQP